MDWKESIVKQVKLNYWKYVPLSVYKMYWVKIVHINMVVIFLEKVHVCPRWSQLIILGLINENDYFYLRCQLVIRRVYDKIATDDLQWHLPPLPPLPSPPTPPTPRLMGHG